MLQITAKTSAQTAGIASGTSPILETTARKKKTGIKVLMIVECAGGGTGRHVMDLSSGLLERGCEVHLLYSERRIDSIFRERLKGTKELHSHVIDMRTVPNPTDVRGLKSIRRYMKANGPFDIVHGHSSKGGAMARLAALGTGAKAFYTLHGFIMMDPCLPRLKWLLYWSIELGLSLITSRIIAVSPEETRAAIRLRLGAKRVVTIPNGVGAPELTARTIARQTMGVNNDAVVIGFVGRLVEQKAPHILLDAFTRAVRQCPQARLALVGAGPLENELKEQAQRSSIADKIIWLGERDARGVLAGFDIFALTSRKEGLPYVVLEAMAAGLPVVATTSSGVEVLVVSGVTGAVIETDDAPAFGDALTDLCSNADRRSAFGRAAHARSALFTIDSMIDRTLETYFSCHGGPQ